MIIFASASSCPNTSTSANGPTQADESMEAFFDRLYTEIQAENKTPNELAQSKTLAALLPSKDASCQHPAQWQKAWSACQQSSNSLLCEPIKKQLNSCADIELNSRATDFDIKRVEPGNRFKITDTLEISIKSLIAKKFDNNVLAEVELRNLKENESTIGIAKDGIEKNEIYQTKLAQGPGVVKYISSFLDHKGKPVLIIEKMKTPLIEVPYESKYFSHLATTLNRLHHLGIIHSDIKPDNIMFTKNMEIKFIDFSVDTSGTEGYQSPNEGDPRKKDIYSLAVTMLEWKKRDQIIRERPKFCYNSVVHTNFTLEILKILQKGIPLDSVKKEDLDDENLYLGSNTNDRLVTYRCQIAQAYIANRIEALQNLSEDALLQQAVDLNLEAYVGVKKEEELNNLKARKKRFLIEEILRAHASIKRITIEDAKEIEKRVLEGLIDKNDPIDQLLKGMILGEFSSMEKVVDQFSQAGL